MSSYFNFMGGSVRKGNSSGLIFCLQCVSCFVGKSVGSEMGSEMLKCEG